MSNGNDVSPAPQQSALAPKQADVSQAPAEGRMGETWPITIPEQVVGSSHEFEFPAPRNLSALGAVGVVSVEGSSELHAEFGKPRAFPGMGSGPLKLTYSPTSVGEKHATLVLVMRWEDGHSERRTILVNARARKLDEAPESQTNSAVSKHNKAPKAAPAPDRVLTVDSQRGWNDAMLAYQAMMAEQSKGVDLVATESQKFKPKPAERSLWQDLAEIAFQLGTGAVAGLVARLVASRVSRAIVGAEHAAAAAKRGEEEIATAEKAAKAARGDVVEEREASRTLVAAKIGNYANADAAKHAKFAEGEVGSAVGNAVSTSITRTAYEIRGGQSADGAADSQQGTKSPVSADGEIAFFSEQTSMIGDLADSGGERLNAELAEYIKQHPEIAGEVMQGVKDALHEAKAGAKERQATSTSAQFMTYLARTNLGTEKLDTADGSKNVTDMTEQRGAGRSMFEPAGLATGVLEIACDYKRGGQVNVTDARARNVSWLVVNRLLDKRLAESGIPMRLSLSGGTTIITRDEAGRVRVAGMLDLAPPHTEAQQVREAERILNVVLSKSLAEWGVPQIHTNDATQGADPKKDTKNA